MSLLTLFRLFDGRGMSTSDATLNRFGSLTIALLNYWRHFSETVTQESLNNNHNNFHQLLNVIDSNLIYHSHNRLWV